ncbi:Flagellar basal body-associated protein-like protein [Ectothiorhodospira sp. PHS-1]|uniref:flagellar basal body-associated FliL family protein n=1 Tax=Ectothiorhodospira sp. PHS-1 TaxID=519989 RepID=UPI00024A8574|nr:flagellar basal body-associated FliL family protein [Ectothiorhodospira sp. PHS-1]EHQ52266.1 Flagellar basal body-associated protein-like protein [Ectothiorhodospira sp. PHS-1]
MRRQRTKPTAFLTALLLIALTGWHAAAWAAPSGGGATWPGYIPLQPALVVNLDNPRRAQYLQLNAQFYVETAQEAQLVEHHMPVIRHHLILFFGGRDPEQVQAAAVREQLRTEALETLRQVMTEHTGSPAVSGLYFTGFIVQ